jgi:UDP-galactopyranose mutase
LKKALIIGGGVGGCVAAIELNARGWNVEIIEASAKLGAGLRTNYIGGHPCTLGPRHFLTHNESTYSYVNKLVPLRSCKDHQFLSYVERDSEFYNYPIHIDDVDRMPESGKIHNELNELDASFRDREFKLMSGTSFADSEKPPADYKEFWLRSIGPTLYDKFISSYTKKMWLVDDESVISDFTWSPKGVAIKRGPREGWDTAISAYPKDLTGYDPIFDLAQSIASVRFNSSVSDIDVDRREVRLGSEVLKADLIINSAPIDLAFGRRYGELKYIGRDIVYFVLPIERALPENVYFTYYCGSERYTRIVEYKKFTRYKSSQTLLSLEFPSMNGRYYPLPVSDQQYLARRYLDDLSNNVFSIGRLGRYNYRYDIDDAVDQALEIVRGL